MGYVEIQSGPYLVKPPAEAFDNGERPVNVEASNIVWLDATDTSWIESKSSVDPSKNAKMTFLWGSHAGDQVNGSLVKLPSGFSGELASRGPTLRVVVIKGKVAVHSSTDNASKPLTTGSYFGWAGRHSHHISCDENSEAVIYVRAQGTYNIVPMPSQK